jgi:hypothetical protein
LQGVDDPPIGAEKTFALVGPGITDDDGLAAAEIEPGGSRLVGHPLGEPEHVFKSLGLGFVRKKPSPAEGGTESRGVDGNDGLETGYLVISVEGLLVSFAGYLVEDDQGVTSFVRPISLPRGY